MRNNTIILIAIIFFVIGCSKNNQTSKTTFVNVDSIKSIILAKENVTLDRWYNGDPMGFCDNSWDDVTYFDPSLIRRIDSIDAFKEFLTPIIGKVHIPSHKFDKPLVRVFGDIAILTFTDVFTVGKDTVRWHATEIYQQRDKEWKLIHSHWTQKVK
jgi:ketosteroid isomerase-like protein